MPAFPTDGQPGNRHTLTRSIKLWAASGVFWLILLVATLVLHRAVSLLVITALFFASSLAQVFYNVRRLRQSIQP